MSFPASACEDTAKRVASRYSIPFSSAAFASLIVVLGDTVLVSTIILVFGEPELNIPFSPAITSFTVLSSGRHKTIMSHWLDMSDGEDDSIPPALMILCIASEFISYTTNVILFRNRFRAIAPPILPNPIIPTFSLLAIHIDLQ